MPTSRATVVATAILPVLLWLALAAALALSHHPPAHRFTVAGCALLIVFGSVASALAASLLLRAALAPDRSPPTPGTAAPAAKVRVLIVDDEPDALLWLSEMLRLTGHEVVCAATREEAEQVAHRAPRPDVALCDLRLPDAVRGQATVAGGARAVAALRALGIPVCVLTGLHLHDHEEVPADGWLVKGGPPEKIVDEVRRLAELSRSKGRLS